MNYYSRNSPIKNRNKKTDPGFLLLNRHLNFEKLRSRASSRLTSRSYFSNPQEGSQSQSSIQSRSYFSEKQQILIQQQDDEYQNRHSEILIIDDQEDQLQNNLKQEDEYSDNYSDSLQQIKQQSSQQDIQQSSVNSSLQSNRIKLNSYEDFPLELSPEQKQFGNSLSHNTFSIQAEENPYNNYIIPRNYSFGNFNGLHFQEQSESQSLKSSDNGSLLHRLFNQQTVVEISEVSNSQKNKKILLKNKREQKNKAIKQSSDESWEIYLKMFMKKRRNQKISSIEANDKEDREDKDKQQKQQSETGQQHSESHNHKKQQIESQASGYFNLPETEFNPIHLFNNANKRQPSSQQALQYPHEDKISSSSSSRIQNPLKQIYFQKQQQLPYTKALNLLTSSFNEVPRSLLAPFLKIHEQLIRKQRQFKTIQTKQRQTIKMMKNLIDCHRKLLYVDDFLLKDSKTSEDEQIQANQQIIMSLIRKISLTF